jgi:hypothetical protein
MQLCLDVFVTTLIENRMYGMRQFYEREARKGKIDIYKTRAMCIAAKYVCSLYIVYILQSNHSIPIHQSITPFS